MDEVDYVEKFLIERILREAEMVGASSSILFCPRTAARAERFQPMVL